MLTLARGSSRSCYSWSDAPESIPTSHYGHQGEVPRVYQNNSIRLDNTLFDHSHSLQAAISEVRDNCPSLEAYQLDDLVVKYNEALQIAYDMYLSKEVTYEETDVIKVQLFYGSLGLPKPDPLEAREFRAIYKPAYRQNRRATAGSIETLIRLRESGYRVAVLTNGQFEDQVAKAEAIGIRHLVDRIITSEEAGSCKPDRHIFQFALEALGAVPSMTYMVGDSVDTDIKGASDTGLDAILYAPNAEDSQRTLLGREVPVIRHMSELFEHIGVCSPS